jgi:hypothetical protein
MCFDKFHFAHLVWFHFFCVFDLDLYVLLFANEFFLFGLICHFGYCAVILFMCVDNNRCKCQYGGT